MLPGAVEQKDLAAFNRETLAKYGLPDVQKEDAHVYRDEDGYYVVKEAFHKPTNPFERLKLAKDPMKDTVHLAYLEEMAKASARTSRHGTKARAPDDVDHRMKYAGLFHRRKNHYGRYMMRLKLPNGVITTEQTRYDRARLIEMRRGRMRGTSPHARTSRCAGGIELKDAPAYLKGAMDLGMSASQGWITCATPPGTPLAGFDPHEVVDTRPFTRDIQDYVTGGGRGNPRCPTSGASGTCAWWAALISSSTPTSTTWRSSSADRDGVSGFNILVGGFSLLRARLQRRSPGMGPRVRSRGGDGGGAAWARPRLPPGAGTARRRA